MYHSCAQHVISTLYTREAIYNMPRRTHLSKVALARNKVAARLPLWLEGDYRNCVCSSRGSELLLDLSREPDWGRDYLLADRSSVAAGETTVNFEVRAL